MPKHAVVFILGTVVTASASLAATPSRDSSSAQHKPSVQASAVREVFQTAPGKDPYRRLFTAEAQRLKPSTARETSTEQGPAVSVQPRRAPDARVVCGMKVIPVDPEVDRKIVVPIPPQIQKESRIRVIEAPPCARP